ncbi:MAG: hypothetical protein AB1899_14215 [Pseudomonadota bacterium]
MEAHHIPAWKTASLVALLALAAPAWAATGTQVGASGKTFASSGVDCAMHPTNGMAPHVLAGLYNPTTRAKANVSLNGALVAKVSFASPDADVWLANGSNTVTVALTKRITDSYVFDATPTDPNLPNVCIPDTSGNTIGADLEYAASNKSYAVVTPGCAWNPLTGRGQPFVNLFVNGDYLLNVSVNNVALTQLNGTSLPHTAVFLSPGLNVISAANAALSTDYYVRDGGDGTCTLP